MEPEITVVIIARDAERTIQSCVAALGFCTRIIVGENNSQDQTAHLARQAGAQVVAVDWEGYGRTKNKLIEGISSGWILSIDSDEIVTPELAREIRDTIAAKEALEGYAIARENYFLRREIRHCGWRPDWQTRLFRAGCGRFEEKHVHEALKITGRLGRLRQPMKHYTYDSVEDYLKRMNAYTTLAANDRFERGKRFSLLRILFDPPWTFLKMYLLKRGFLDGFPGFALCLLSALNTLAKHAKLWEQGKGLTAGRK